MPLVDHYACLEVHPRASEAVIRAAHQALVSTGDKAALDEALATLTDANRRAAYDEQRAFNDGTVIGQYKVLRKIAEGGIGNTYQAEHLWLRTPVCIKHCSRISTAMDRILENEARAVWDLRHFGIPAMRDIIRLDDGSSAIVMSYVPGDTLEQTIQKNGQMSPEDVAWVIERNLNILRYMHERGVVHGDIKPQNIIVEDPVRHLIVLVDYGLTMVKPRGTDRNLGYTEIYSPPEQEDQANPGPLLPETDFYSLGMTALFALTNNERQIRRKQIPSSVPKPMRDFLVRLIAREVLERPNWDHGDLYDEFVRVRTDSFGRAHSTGFRRGAATTA